MAGRWVWAGFSVALGGTVSTWLDNVEAFVDSVV